MDLSTKVFNKFKDGTLPWLELDINFGPYIDTNEFDRVDKYYVDHRENESHIGWSSCCLHGLGIDKTQVAKEYGYTDELNAPYSWTKLSEITPAVKMFWDKFPVERYSRIRFMKLKSYGKIDWHNDHPGHELPEDLCDYLIPINVAVQHPALCYMEVKDHGLVPFGHGKVFLINILKDHQVVNNANVDRIHMIAQAHIGNQREQFNELLDRSIKKYGISI